MALDDRGARDMQRLRDDIDRLDQQILKLLCERSRLAIAIGRVKRRYGLPIHSPEREREVLSLAQEENPGPLDGPAVRRLFERIIDESRRLERRTIAEEGDQGT